MSSSSTGTSGSNPDSGSERPSFLRRCSISDPRLNILPNFTQENYNPFNRMFSGILGEGSTFSLSKGTSTESMDGHQILQGSPPNSNNPKGGSAVNVVKHTPDTVPSTGMRKSASTANTGISSFFGTSPHHHFTTIPETEDQQDRGLTMSARPNNNVLAAAKDVQQQQKVIVANTNHTGSAAPAAAVAASPPHKTGIFGSGFLSRPVLNNQEENYRYIMALDR